MKLLILIFLCFHCSVSFSQSASEIIRKADELMKSKSSYAEISMTVVKPNWSRTIVMKSWALEPDYFLIYILEPARDKGTVTLKREKEVWNWIPSAQKTIKIPPSMMMQSWMGSDFTNDDLVRSSSVVDDYTAKLLGEEKYENYDCYKIELIPKPSAGVVWGKIETWITKQGYLQLKSLYYDEEGVLVKSFVGSKVKEMSGRMIPTYWEMLPQNEPKNKTIFEYLRIKFNYPIEKTFFSIQNMQKVR